jgi:hypothetical protein
MRMDKMEKRMFHMIERGNRGIEKHQTEKKSDIDRLNDSIK